MFKKEAIGKFEIVFNYFALDRIWPVKLSELFKGSMHASEVGHFMPSGQPGAGNTVDPWSGNHHDVWLHVLEYSVQSEDVGETEFLCFIAG